MLYLDEHIFDFDLPAALNSISPQRREQALHFRFELGQRQCVLAYMLLKKGLQQEYGICDNPLFRYGPHGKPLLADHPDIHFSLSHCREAVACAVGSKPVGVDVESVREYKEMLVNYTMNKRETEQIMSDRRPAAAFTRLWTMKEAALKLSGEGIGDNIKNVLEHCEHLRFTTTADPQQRYFCTLCEEL